ncbi:MAG: 5-formyltetrahydrofolate cyclo-ligase, partial [Desulfofustis sp.]
MMDTPGDIRSDVLARRDRLAIDQRSKKSRQIAAALLSSNAALSSETFFIYVSFRSEVETLPIITELLKRGKVVTVPLTRVEQKRLDIVRITDIERDLVPGYCNIPEPHAECAAAGTVAAADLDLIVLPGSVFDERGGRYGYGGGYYDRLLAEVPTALRYGLAYEMQIREKLDLQPHDQLLDRI